MGTTLAMDKLQDHPTVQRVRAGLPDGGQGARPKILAAEALRELCLSAGADDVGFVSVDRPELDDQRADILRAFPKTRTLISIVCRMNREPVRSVARSAANLEFHHTTDQVNDVAREIVRRLEARGLASFNPSAGFPMEMDRFPGKVWIVSHKPVAVAAGLGQMGIHRNVIHPRFGNFIILGTVLVDAEIDVQSRPIDYNPCLSCKLCVAACPVGAIKADGRFDASACMTHNYREFMNGFTEWVERVVDSTDAADYRRRVSDAESASMWQSLSFGANYKAAYCLAVCPAGEEVIPPFLDDRAGFISATVRPLQEKAETVYVVPDSDAEEYVAKRFPHKRAKQVSGIRPSSIAGFLSGLPIVFQGGQAKGLDALYHFTFYGSEESRATVIICDQRITVLSGHDGQAHCTVVADAATWLGFLRKERSMLWAIIRGKVRVRGKLSLLKAFGRCFPA